MIACLCEGNAEREIMDILMENGLLSFSMDDLLSNARDRDTDHTWEGRYEDFRKSRKKPSEYCKSELGMRNVKSREFVRSYFLDADRLLKALRLYREYYGRTQDPSDIILYDLLNEGARRRADSL